MTQARRIQAWHRVTGCTSQVSPRNLESWNQNLQIGKIIFGCQKVLKSTLVVDIDTRSFWIQERVQDGDLSIKKVPTAKNCEDVGTKPGVCFSTATTLQVCRIGFLLDMDPTLHYRMKVTSL